MNVTGGIQNDNSLRLYEKIKQASKGIMPEDIYYPDNGFISLFPMHSGYICKSKCYKIINVLQINRYFY